MLGVIASSPPLDRPTTLITEQVRACQLIVVQRYAGPLQHSNFFK